MSQVAMFSKTGSSDFPTYLKCMISGPPKSGKTSMLGTVPNILILDTEPHANNLQSVAHLDIPFKAISSTDDLKQAHFVLSQESFRKQAAEALGMTDIEAVAIDTLDSLQAIMKRERMREQRTNKFLRDDWGWLKEEMTAILESFLSLPMHVFFVVHTKSENVGTEDNPRTVILPGLEGSIARQIAGMVGYSLLAFRKEEIRADGSGKFTKYWLRAEGDETYEYLGNRAAGRLPDVIEPDFKTLLTAALADRPTQEHREVSVELTGIEKTGKVAQEAPAQTSGQAEVKAPAASPADDEPMNAAALGHVKKVYEAIGQPFPETKIEALNLGQARALVMMWKAAQADALEGKSPNGESAEQTMLGYLQTNDLLAPEGSASPQVSATQPNIQGTIDEVKAYVGDSLERANEALLAEMGGKNRLSLISWLESKGASVAASQPVTPDSIPADSSITDQQAVTTVQEVLGGQVVGEEIHADALCEQCGNQIDDTDLAQLGKSRFGRILCVADYIAETKK